MKNSLIATALLMIGASASAETYHVNGVTIHVPTDCASTSCVSVAAPEYGYYHTGRRAKAHKERSDVKAASVSTKKDQTAVAVPAATPPAPAAAAAADPAPPPAKTVDKTADAPAAAAPEPLAAK
jgi:hypothetical protein